MKLFELIQIIPTPTKAALKSGDLTKYDISDARIMGYLRNNSIFNFGKADRAKTSATIREILEAMWPFNGKFERALSMFSQIKDRVPQRGVSHGGLTAIVGIGRIGHSASAGRLAMGSSLNGVMVSSVT
jgi:hypothetical protein